MLEDISQLTAQLGIALLIPYAVEVELETLWLHDLHLLRNNEKVADHVAGITKGVLFPTIDLGSRAERLSQCH